ncbi:MAG: hypothetical protein QOF09_2682 [Alphaproteobacteria bacterium]|jgi:hypothetical protein|nr:hypothetical protein [Alphaproteobacteria bacterium]
MIGAGTRSEWWKFMRAGVQIFSAASSLAGAERSMPEGMFVALKILT